MSSAPSLPGEGRIITRTVGKETGNFRIENIGDKNVVLRRAVTPKTNGAERFDDCIVILQTEQLRGELISGLTTVQRKGQTPVKDLDTLQQYRELRKKHERMVDLGDW